MEVDDRFVVNEDSGMGVDAVVMLKGIEEEQEDPMVTLCPYWCWVIPGKDFAVGTKKVDIAVVAVVVAVLHALSAEPEEPNLQQLARRDQHTR